MPKTYWQTSRFVIDLSQPKVMGIVNITPDSFSDGGQFESNAKALKHAENLLKQGADILDIGGESSRPGAKALSVEDELSRVLPFVREAVKWQVPLSIDTYKPEVMHAALDLGADIINDIWAMRQAGAWEVMVQFPKCGMCLMHMHRDPQTMQTEPMTGHANPPWQRWWQCEVKSRCHPIDWALVCQPHCWPYKMAPPLCACTM